MPPIYQYRVSMTSQQACGCIVVGLIALTMLPLWVGSMEAIPSWARWTLLVVALFILSAAPVYRVSFHRTHIRVRFGLGYIHRKDIHNRDILSIQDATLWSPSERSKWKALKGSYFGGYSGPALAVMGIDKNYIIGCPKPEEALRVLMGILDPGVVMIDEQKAWPEGERREDQGDVTRPCERALPGEPIGETWTPFTRSLASRDFPPSKPIYRFSDYSIWVIFVNLALIALLLFAPHPDAAFRVIFVILLLAWGLFLDLYCGLVPNVRVEAFSNRIEVRNSLIWPRKYTLQVDNIKRIGPVVFDRARDFTYFSMKPRGKGHWHGWLAFLGSLTNRGVAIESSEGNILISCPNADLVSTELKQLMGGG